MKVKEVMSSELQGVKSDSSLRDAAERMRLLDVGSLPVVSPDQSRVVGIVTDRDIVVRAVAQGEDVSKKRVEDIMSGPLVCCHETDELVDASKTMKSKKVRRVLVLNDTDQPVGMLSLGDVASSTGIEDAELKSLLRYVASP